MKIFITYFNISSSTVFSLKIVSFK